MHNIDELKDEINRLNQKVNLLEQELYSVKQELYKQLNYRESELKEVMKWEEKYKVLQKRYEALRNSSLGNLTVKYWNVRKKFKKGLSN